LQKALIASEKNDAERALAEYKQVIELNPLSVGDYKNWGRPDDKEKRGKALDNLEEMLLKSKDEALAHSKQGIALHKKNELEQAIAEYDQAVKLYPRSAEVYYNRGLAYRQKDNMDQALLDYTQAILLDPKYIPAYANRGYAFYKLGDFDRALADFDKILEFDPANAEAKKSKQVLMNMRVGGDSPSN
jgi:tetratricopeptide (TPR) repeat protein